ncbi:MAG: lysophospholipid acyltransferase family protein [Pseudomonadota bacterium]
MLTSFLTILKAALIASFYWLLSLSWRMKVLGRVDLQPQGNGKLYAHWHGDELLMLRLGQFTGMAAMASRSKDGELMKWVLRIMGFKVVRGSSSKGGAGGLKGLLDFVAKTDSHTSLAVDGPRGPIYEVKPGILALAQKTGKAIIPVVGSAEKRFVFKKAWNQCYLPLPFSKCVAIYGEPISISPTATDNELEIAKEVLRKQLIELKGKAEENFNRTFLPALRMQSLNGA